MTYNSLNNIRHNKLATINYVSSITFVHNCLSQGVRTGNIIIYTKKRQTKKI